MSAISAKVVRIVSGHLGVEPNMIIPEASWIDDLDADSLDTVELIMSFEEEFDIDIPEVDAERIRTVQDAVDYISARTSAGSAGSA
jgi:acyl carrier protein